MRHGFEKSLRVAAVSSALLAELGGMAYSKTIYARSSQPSPVKLAEEANRLPIRPDGSARDGYYRQRLTGGAHAIISESSSGELNGKPDPLAIKTLYIAANPVPGPNNSDIPLMSFDFEKRQGKWSAYSETAQTGSKGSNIS